MSGRPLDVTSLGADDHRHLRRTVLGLADTKRILGIRYSDWLLGAPSIEAGIAASAMAQDEWGHARLIYAVLKDLGRDPREVEHERPAEEYCSVACLDRPLEDWASVVAAVAVVDGVLSVALDGVRRGSWETLAGRAGKMLAEEEFHRSLGAAWVGRLAEGAPEARERIRASVAAMWPDAVRTLAPDDEAHGRVAELGVTDAAPDLRARMGEAVGPLLERVDVDPDLEPGPPSGWNPERARGPGGPDPEAVERARGDRNRELFVE